MRSVISRPVRSLVVLAAAGLLLAGCGSGPSQVGAAAIVDNTRIPVTDVQSWFNDVMRKEPGLKPQLQKQGQMDELGRQLATFTVQQELIKQMARDEHLSVDEQKVSDLINRLGGPQAATAGKVYTPENFRDGVRSQLLTAELGRKYVDQLSVTFDFTQATTRREAEVKARQMAEGPRQAAALLDADRAAGLRVGAGERLRPADSVELATKTPLFAADPGTVLAFKPDAQGGQWLVVLIKQRDTNSPSPTPVAPQTDQKTLHDVGMQLLGLTADHAGVRLSPRYGVWDPIGLTAVPTEGETLGLRLKSPSA